MHDVFRPQVQGRVGYEIPPERHLMDAIVLWGTRSRYFRQAFDDVEGAVIDTVDLDVRGKLLSGKSSCRHLGHEHRYNQSSTEERTHQPAVWFLDRGFHP